MVPIEDIKRYLLARQDEHITLADLADWADVSRFHLQREFKKRVGLSPFNYLERVRLRKAASSLVIQNETVLNIALNHGYNNHETFTRAFRRHFDVSPRDYRLAGRLLSSGVPPERTTEPAPFGSWQLSRPRIQKTNDLYVRGIRQLGPYEEVPPTLWARVQKDCVSQQIEFGAMIGIGWDNPATTAAEELRFDAGVLVNDVDHANHVLRSRHWIVSLYTGSFAELGAAYEHIARRAAEIPGVRLSHGPILEVYHVDDMEVPEITRYLEVFVPAELSNEELA